MNDDWVFLTDKEREKIAYDSGPYIVDGYEPHEAEVRKRNPRDDWKGLTKEERKEINASIPKPCRVRDIYASLEAKLKEKNHG
jgi:predicted Fe-S protein YdhL (DUF1289 family)